MPGPEPGMLARSIDEDGMPNLDGIIEDVLQKQAVLSSYIDRHTGALKATTVTRLLNVYDRTVATLMSLVREQAAQVAMTEGTFFLRSSRP